MNPDLVRAKLESMTRCLDYGRIYDILSSGTVVFDDYARAILTVLAKESK